MRAIRKLLESFPQSRTILFLVDNSQDSVWGLELFAEESVDLRALNVDLRLLRGQGNVGFGRGHNLVLPELNSTYHLILNPDVVLEQECLVQGIKYLQQHPHTGVVSPYATGYDGQKQHLCKTYPALLTFLVRGFIPAALKPLFKGRLNRFEMHHLSESDPTVGIPIVSGCFMLCRTEVLKNVKGFDEQYFLYFEDFDLSLRIGKIADIAYYPAMRIHHTGGHAARKGIRHLGMFFKSAIHFFSTHGWRLFKQS